MIQGIGHIGIAVRNMETSLKAACKAFDLPIPPIRDNVERKMKVAVLNVQGLALEFIEDYSEEGEFARFVRERGDAIHHFCLLSDDMEADAQSMEQRGIQFRIRKPTLGLRGKKIVFTEPSALNGIPFELSEP